VTAVFSGDGNFTGSTTSSATDQVVNKVSTSVAVAISPEPTVSGQPVVVSITATSTAGTPSGQVQVEIDGSLAATLTLDSQGKAAYTDSALSVGDHTVIVHYLGASDYQTTDSSAGTHEVDKATTTIVVASSPTPTVFGQPTTLTASIQVSAPGSGHPGGTVSFYDGTTLLGTGTVDPVTGLATLTSASLPSGNHAFTVSYTGDGSFLPTDSASSGHSPVSHDVNLGNVTVSVTPSPAPSVWGQPVTIAVVVTAAAPAVGTPSGTVTVSDGSTTLTTLTLASGAASTSTAALVVGAHTLNVQYAGDTSFNPGSGNGALTVNKSSAALALAVSPSPSMHGQSVTLTAQVTAVGPGAGSPSGIVTFYDGATVLGTGTIGAGGIATFSTGSGAAALAGGAHSLSASYSADGQFLTTSGGASLQVDVGSTTIAVSSSRNPSRIGRPVQLSATVSSPHATPDGSVTFHDSFGGRQSTLGTATLASGSGAITVRDLTKGLHAVTVTYDGNGDFAAASGTLDGGEQVENTPPVAGSGTALQLGPAAAASASADVSGGALDQATSTIELWARAAWTSAGAIHGTAGLVRLGDASAARIGLSVSPDRKSVVVTRGTSSATIPAALDDGQWHHLAVTASDVAVTLSVDGATAGSVDGPLDATIVSTVMTMGDGFVGELDELRFWSGVRSAAQLAADARRPLHGNEAGLLGDWRMDEGSGLELFDSGPSGLDALATLSAGVQTAAVFASSGAWRDRHVWEERDLAPVDAGYDADGDPLTLTVSAAPSHGKATVDADNLQIDYHAGAMYLGEDQFTFRLDDGTAQDDYTVLVTVDRILVCQANADCGGGDLCVEGLCQTHADLQGKAGSSCATSGGGPLPFWLVLSLGLLALARARAARRRAQAARRVLLVLGVLLLPAAARSQTPNGFLVQTYAPPPAGDQFFTVSDPTGPGHLVPSAALVASWAASPLVLRIGGEDIPGGRIVHRQLWGFAQGSLGFGERLLFEVTVPAALYQSGSHPMADLGQVAASGIGDVRVGVRYSLGDFGKLRLALAGDAWIPSGSRAGFASDGSARFEPKLIAGMEEGDLSYRAQVGVLVRNGADFAIGRTSSAVTFAAAAGWHVGDFRLGPEVYGRVQFQGIESSPVEALLGGHFAQGVIDVGLAVGTGLDRAPGAAPLRMVATFALRPSRTKPPPPLVCEPPPKPPPPPPLPPPPPPEPVVEPPPPAPVAVPEPPPPPKPAPPPPSKPALVVLTKEKIEILQSIQFEKNQDVIQPESEPILRAVAGTLSAHPEIARIRIEGHTDSQGSAVRNTLLSEKRAQAVRLWLMEKGGIAGARLEARGYGPTQPVAPNKTAAGRSKNRRVEFRILE